MRNVANTRVDVRTLPSKAAFAGDTARKQVQSYAATKDARSTSSEEGKFSKKLCKPFSLLGFNRCCVRHLTSFIVFVFPRVCWTHGAKASAKICSHKGEEECKSVAVKDGVCWKHSAKDLAIEAYSASGDSADALCMPTDNDKKPIILGGMAGMMAASLDAVEDLAMTSGSESAGSHVEPLMAEAYTQYMAEDLQYLEDLPELPVMEI